MSTRLRIAKADRVNSDSCLDGNRAYTADQLMRSIGIGWRTLEEGRKAGFIHPVITAKRNVYFGREVMAYLEHLQKQQYPELEAAS